MKRQRHGELRLDRDAENLSLRTTQHYVVLFPWRCVLWGFVGHGVSVKKALCMAVGVFDD